MQAEGSTKNRTISVIVAAVVVVAALWIPVSKGAWSVVITLLIVGVVGVVSVRSGMLRRARGRRSRDTLLVRGGPAGTSGPPCSSAAAVPLLEVPVALTRRSALKRLGAGGVAIAAPLLGLSAAKGQEVATKRGPAVGSSGRIRQWGMIIDLRRCDGCQSQGTAPKCTLACIEGHLAPEPMEWIQVYEAELAGGGTQFLPTPCQQCENPPCVNVCPVAATFSTPEGVVLIDQNRCIGCRICMAACPYDRRFFNWGTAPVPPEAFLADYSPHHQIPAQRGTVMKCDFCVDLVRAGSLPQCTQACPQGAIYYGDLEEDIATNGRELVGFRDYVTRNSTYRLKEDLGTQPRVHYIPGHGEEVGRDPHTEGRLATVWPWIERANGAVTWRR